MTWSSAQGLIDFILSRQLISNAFVEELGNELSRFDSAEALVDELVGRGYLSSYQHSQLLAKQEEKLFFGQYRLVAPLGVGGMGEVFKAWQPRLDRYVALKFIHKEYLNAESNALGRFQREAHAIGQMQHPNIIVLYDADEVDGVPFIALEFVDGLSLSDMVSRKGPLGVRQASEYIRQAALGLHHAYECGFVHRDIKPSNIVVCQTTKKSLPGMAKKTMLITRNELKRVWDGSANWELDRVKILDMGLARFNRSLASGLGPEATLTESGTVLGTPDYLAPEQARNPSNVDIRADLYSLGCTFYFVLSGRTPFPGGTAVEKVLRHQCDEPESIKKLRSELPDTIVQVVNKLLAKSPDERFQTPLDLAKELAKFVNGPSVDLEAPSSTIPPTRCTLPTLIAINASAGTKTLANTPRTTQPVTADSIVIPPAKGASPTSAVKSAETFNFSESDFDDISLKLNVDVGSTQARSSRVRPTVKLDGHNGAVSGVALTRNGRTAATADVNGQIRVWDLERSTPREIDRRYRRCEIQAVTFAPHDLNYIVIGESRPGKTTLVYWDWKSDIFIEVSDLTYLGQKDIGCLKFTVDGGLLAAAVGTVAVTWKVGVGSLTQRKVHRGIDKPIRTIAISPDRKMLAASGHDGSLHFWNLGSGNWGGNGFKARPPIASITTMKFSPDSSILAMAGLDKRVVLWPIAHDSEEPVALCGHHSNIHHVQFIGKGRELASVGMDGHIIVWDVRKGSKVREYQIDLGLAYRVEMSSDGSRVVAGFTNGLFGVYELSAVQYAEPAFIG